MHNQYYILRHGQAYSNVKEIISCWPEKFHNPLTSKGKQQIETTAKKLKTKNIDLIFASDVLRTRETAEIVGKEIGIKPKYDKRLREYNVGVFNNRPIQEFRDFLPNRKGRFANKPLEGETYKDIQNRMYSFLEEIDNKYSNKTILIVSHQLNLMLLDAKINKIANKDFCDKYFKNERFGTGEFNELGLSK
ncbi:MAG: histidine phosphatase family protein [Patescibacteria group bacterium]|nr:histidine phosphatase family protein [Patescibacteria group bacterium]